MIKTIINCDLCGKEINDNAECYLEVKPRGLIVTTDSQPFKVEKHICERCWDKMEEAFNKVE